MMDINFLAKVLLSWCINTFGEKYAGRRERAIRVLEEVAELCQSENISEEQAVKLIQLVWSRPKGFPYREVGGVFVTLLCYAQAAFPWRVRDILMREVYRVLETDPEVFKVRNQEKIHDRVSAV